MSFVHERYVGLDVHKNGNIFFPGRVEVEGGLEGEVTGHKALGAVSKKFGDEVHRCFEAT
jgi:hypothetical protein